MKKESGLYIYTEYISPALIQLYLVRFIPINFMSCLSRYDLPHLHPADSAAHIASSNRFVCHFQYFSTNSTA